MFYFIFSTILILFSTSGCQGPTTYDLVIQGGNLVDGTGGPSRRADVAIQDDTISTVGTVSYTHLTLPTTPYV